jgi:hypothetical protein
MAGGLYSTTSAPTASSMTRRSLGAPTADRKRLIYRKPWKVAAVRAVGLPMMVLHRSRYRSVYGTINVPLAWSREPRAWVWRCRRWAEARLEASLDLSPVTASSDRARR